jgi:hypothetical protein
MVTKLPENQLQWQGPRKFGVFSGHVTGFPFPKAKLRRIVDYLGLLCITDPASWASVSKHLSLAHASPVKCGSTYVYKGTDACEDMTAYYTSQYSEQYDEIACYPGTANRSGTGYCKIGLG